MGLHTIGKIILFIASFSALFAAEPPLEVEFRDIGDYPYPGDPMDQRAQGFLLSGKAKTISSNYGNYVNWDHRPAGLWKEFTYIAALGFMAGVRGHRYSSFYQDWVDIDMQTYYPDWNLDGIEIWCSDLLFDDWNLDYQSFDFDTNE